MQLMNCDPRRELKIYMSNFRYLRESSRVRRRLNVSLIR